MKELPNKANLTIYEVAAFFGVHPRTIRRWMEEDPDFPRPFKKGLTMRFSREEVMRWYEAYKYLKANIQK